MIGKNFKAFVFSGVLCLGMFLIVSPSRAEDINQQILDLRKQVEELTKQAKKYESNINQKQKEANTLSRQISILNNQISQLETQISITEKEIQTSKLEISDLEDKIFEAQEKINIEKSAVAKIITAINDRDHTSLAVILIKNPSLASFSAVVNEDEAINAKLNSMLVVLKKEKEEMQTVKTELETKKQELEILNNQQKNQHEVAKDTKEDKNQLLTTTKGKEQEYQKMLAAVKAKEQAFFDELKRLESEAIKSGAYIVHITAQSVPPKGTWKIRWPEDSYRLTQGYGMTAYARSGAYGGSGHNGIDLAHGRATPIHSVDFGAILASGTSDGWGNWVAVLHDNGMVSLYGHFMAPSGLANGTRVTPDSVIGYEGTTGNSTGSHVHLSIYKDFFTYYNAKHKNQLYFNYFDGTVNPLNYLP
jgi:murein DD-endopeptidase MepM/ murein hydrolase activator NlpD